MDIENIKPPRFKADILREIKEIETEIKELEPLETKHFHLLNLRYDTGLEAEEYSAWQKLQALRVNRSELTALKKELEAFRNVSD